MEPMTIPVSAKSSVLGLASDDNPTWFNVDLRFVIAAIVVFGAVVATTIRFSHELFDPLTDSFMLQGWAAVIVRPSLLWFSMGTLLLVIRTLLWVRYRPSAAVDYERAPRMSVIIPAYNEGPLVRKAVEACACA